MLIEAFYILFFYFTGEFISYFTVSYTHLDVYKRQFVNCFPYVKANSHPLLRTSPEFNGAEEVPPIYEVGGVIIISVVNLS